jgi:hypothetical protein
MSIRINVSVRREDKQFKETIYKDEDYNISKSNPDFAQEILRVIRSASFISDDIFSKRDYTVRISTSFEW